MELLESLVSYIVVGGIGAGIVWYPNRGIKRQFFSMMEAIDEGKVQDRDWKLIRDETGSPTGFRVMLGASSPTDKPYSN